MSRTSPISQSQDLSIEAPVTQAHPLPVQEGALAAGSIGERGGRITVPETQGLAFADRLASDLSQPHPRPRSGSPSIATRALRHSLLESLEAGVLKSDPVLLTYACNLCSVLALKGYSAEDLRDPSHRAAFVDRVCTDTALLREMGLSNYLIKKRAHLYTIGEISDTIQRSRELFAPQDGKRSNANTMIDLVIRGVYASADQVHERYTSLRAEAAKVFGAQKETETVQGQAAFLVLHGERRSISDAHAAYVQALQDAERIAATDPGIVPLVRTMAGLVMGNRYDSMQEAYRAYKKVHRAVSRVHRHGPLMGTLTRSTAMLMYKGTYKSPARAGQAMREIRAAMQEEITRSPQIASYARSLELLVYQRTYKSAAAVAERFKVELAKAEERFEPDSAGRSLARTAAYLVVQKRYPSVEAVHQKYQELLGKADEAIERGEEGGQVSRSLVLAVIKGEQESFDSALKQYESVLAESKSKFLAVFRSVYGAKSAAMQVVRGRYGTVDEAVSAFGQCLDVSRTAMERSAKTSDLVFLFARLLFDRAIGDIKEGRTHYLQILDECGREFSQHPDTKPVIRTAALLVFRGIYESPLRAKQAYFDCLAAARDAYRHEKDADGADVPGVRTMAMNLFDDRGKGGHRLNPSRKKGASGWGGTR